MRATKRTATYASLSSPAASLPVPETAAIEAALKNPRDFKIIGKRIRGVDNLDIVTGSPVVQHRRRVSQHALRGAGEVRRLRREGRQRQPRRDQEAAWHQARLHRRAGGAGQQLARLGRGDRGRQLVARQRRANAR